jgi:two-component system sensor histidine kinase UhpB
VGQKLTAVLLMLDRLARADAGAIEAREGVRETLEDVRTIASRLRPETLDSLGLVSALAALTNSLERGGAIRIERRVDRSLPQLSGDAELAVYRVAQEALTNAVRHGGCHDARLELRQVRGGVQLDVIDRGVGFEPAVVSEGAGIRGMRERSLLVGASLDVVSATGTGTRVTLRVPAARNQAAPAASS